MTPARLSRKSAAAKGRFLFDLRTCHASTRTKSCEVFRTRHGAAAAYGASSRGANLRCSSTFRLIVVRKG